jgi:alpha-amylase/alpha-mannosidase (GH57 family)
MKHWLNPIKIIVVLSILFSACTSSKENIDTLLPTPTEELFKPTEINPTEEVEEVDEVLYLNLIWHQHQPLYYKNEEGVYTRPWVRVHATKDYYDMASILIEYPDVKLTFNLTPVLIKQLEDYSNNGAIDLYWQYALIPPDQLTIDQKKFILSRFFDVNWDNIIAKFPRYQELLNKRGGATDEEIELALTSFSNQDFLDLQIWFNLAWFDPDFLGEEPLKSMVGKQKGFTEEDKQILFDEALRVIREVIPVHKELQDKGQIEVITTPYAHPILPLIIDSNLAAIGNPTTDLPPNFSYPMDAISHLEKSVEMYETHYGQAPRGLWPGEGSVAQVMVPSVIEAGYQWMATGEPVLAKSLGIDSFTRDTKEIVREADLLYRPYYVKNENGDKLAVFFRDGNLSDKIGFTYSGVSGASAAKDLMDHLESIREQLKSEGSEGTHIVSIIVDGENAWEYYKNDGKEFFHALYQSLTDSKTIKTITPSEYLEKFPEQQEIEDLFPGAWFSPNYDTWIGEPEENQAWDYLRRTREVLAKYDVSNVRKASPDAIALAQDFMYLAEGSDWFWWYGADQDSGQDSYFDEGFRALLRNVFISLGEPVPTFVDIPIIQARPISPDQPISGLSTPEIDGVLGEGEWDNAGLYKSKSSDSLGEFKFSQDEKNLYFLLNSEKISGQSNLGIYIKSPRGVGKSYPYTNSEGDMKQLLGAAVTHLFEWSNNELNLLQATEKGWTPVKDFTGIAKQNTVFEMAIPFEILGELETGDEIQFILVDEITGNRIPEAGPGQIIVPDLGLLTILMDVNDSVGDDFGPGNYTYPTDAVFPPKAFDLKSFRVAYDENNLVFKFEFWGPIPNPWGSPNNLAIQTLDVYIDTDPGQGTGARMLLPGRNLSLSADNGWEYAIWAEGWTPQLVSPDPETLEPKQISPADFKIIVDPAGSSVTIRVAKTMFADWNPEAWGYAAMVMGQEGYPSTGVWRVRDVEAVASQWRFGGAVKSTNHTRVIDLIWPDGDENSQIDMLSGFKPIVAAADKFTVDDFAIIELLIPNQ